MNKIAIGFAALLMLGAAPAVLAEGAKVSAGATVDADAGAEVDVTTTGSVNANYGTLVTGLESNQDIDLSAYSDSSTINCVTVSSLQGNSDAGASLEGALTTSEDRRVSLQGDIQSNSALWADIQASCTGIADLAVEDVLWIESGADGSFTIYVDDRA